MAGAPYLAEVPITTITATLTSDTSNEDTIVMDDITTDSEIPNSSANTNMPLTNSTTSMTTDSVHNVMDSERNTRVITLLLILVGILLLLMLPGAIYGFVKVSRTIISYEIKTFKDPAASVDTKYIIIGKTTT